LYFREEDAPFFFGREIATQRLLDAVTRQSLIAVVGASGSGKSSVVRAGLLPRLRRGGDRVWEVATLVPGDRPLYALAATLAPLLEPDMNEVDRLIEITRLSRALQENDLKVRDVVERALAKQPGTDRLLLVADQWEELYTLTPDEAGRRRFIDELLEASRTAPLSVVLTLRGRFRRSGARLSAAVRSAAGCPGERRADDARRAGAGDHGAGREGRPRL
jgi:KaiC/GvpD/RAD55 family RecA-like ATPase